MCICICGLFNGFNITVENYSNKKVFPCKTAPWWVKHKGSTLNSNSGIPKVQLAGGRGRQTFTNRRPPCQLRPHIWCVIRHCHTNLSAVQLGGWRAPHLDGSYCYPASSWLICGVDSVFWCEILHLVNKFCKKGFLFSSKSPLSFQQLNFYLRLYNSWVNEWWYRQ